MTRTNWIQSSLFGLFLVLLSSTNSMAIEHIVTGEKAYDRGEYETAYKIATDVIAHGFPIDWPDGQVLLGKLYMNGHGVKKSTKIGWNHYQKAVKVWTKKKLYSNATSALEPLAKQNYMPAKIELAKLRIKDGDPYGGKAFIREQAAKGNQLAQLEEAKMIRLHGEGSRVQRWDQMAAMLKKLAEAGYAPGQRMYGMMFANNLGPAKDLKMRFFWQKKSADQGFADGQYNTAYLYSMGMGVETSYPNAVKYYKMAAKQNHAKSQYELARAYQSGLGIEKNIEKAIFWYEKTQSAADPTTDLRQDAFDRLSKLNKVK